MSTTTRGLADPPRPAAGLHPMPGSPLLLLSAYELASAGFVAREFGLSGTAVGYGLDGPASSDGDWTVTPASDAAFSTRLVVLRPTDAARFNGTVVVEWLNVTSGQDMPIVWMATHREMLRKGYAYVAVSTQKAGIDGHADAPLAGAAALRTQDPVRYAGLSHPGDAHAFDIFSRAGEAVRQAPANGLLGGLRPQRIIAAGESQSAAFLTTYLNAVDPVARVYDGFFVHSRFGDAATIDGSRMETSPDSPRYVRLRQRPRVPVMAVITETDLLGAGNAGYHGARREDGPNLRVRELPGSSHGDNYLFGGALVDSGLGSAGELQRLFAPPSPAVAGTPEKPFNPGMVHHYAAQAALAALDVWIRTGRAPDPFPPMDLAVDEAGPRLVRDAVGIATGGVRTPWVDVPTLRLSGVGGTGSFMERFGGSAEPLDAETLRALYPGGRDDYLARFGRALASAIASGAILADDEQEILSLAASQFPSHQH